MFQNCLWMVHGEDSSSTLVTTAYITVVDGTTWEYHRVDTDDDESTEQAAVNDSYGSSVIELNIDGQPVKSILDTGADKSLCSTRLWESHDPALSCLILFPSPNIVLKDYYTGTHRKGVRGTVS